MKKLKTILFLLVITLSVFAVPYKDQRGIIRMLYGGDTLTMSFDTDSVLFDGNNIFLKINGSLVIDSLKLNGVWYDKILESVVIDSTWISGEFDTLKVNDSLNVADSFRVTEDSLAWGNWFNLSNEKLTLINNAGNGFDLINNTNLYGLELENNEGGRGINITTSSGTGLFVTNTGTSSASAIYLQNSSTGRGITGFNSSGGYMYYIYNSSYGIAHYIDNVSTGKAVYINNSGTGNAIEIDNDEGYGVWIKNGSGEDGTLLKIDSSSVEKVRIDNDTSRFNHPVRATLLMPENMPYGIGGYEDSTITVTISAVNTWYEVTNSTGNSQIGLYGYGISASGDTTIVNHAGVWRGVVNVTFSGTNGNEYEFRVYNCTQGTQSGFKMGTTARGTSDYMNVSIIVFDEANEGDKYIFQVRNKTTNNNAIFRHLTFEAMYINE